MTKSYGLDEIPAADSLPRYTMKYADYGFTELTPEVIIDQMDKWRSSKDLETTLRFLSSKVGFDPNDE